MTTTRPHPEAHWAILAKLAEERSEGEKVSVQKTVRKTKVGVSLPKVRRG